MKHRDVLLALITGLTLTLSACGAIESSVLTLDMVAADSSALPTNSAAGSSSTGPMTSTSTGSSSEAAKSPSTSSTTPTDSGASTPPSNTTAESVAPPSDPAPVTVLTLYSMGSNIRQEPTTDSIVVGSAGFGEELLVSDTGLGWYQLADGRGFVSATLVSTEQPTPEPVAAAAPAAQVPVADAAAQPGPAPAANPAPVPDPAPTPAPAPQPDPAPAPAPVGNCPADPGACSYQQGGDFGIIAAINAERSAAGLAPLSGGDSTASQSCALASARAGSLNHCGYEALWGGTFSPDAGSVVAAWMNSSGHRAMLLNPNVTWVAVGYATRSDQYTVVAATLG